MIVNGTKDCTAARRNLSAVASLVQGVAGDVGGGLPVLTHLEDISEAKQAGSASSPFSTRKLWSASVCSMNI